MEEYDVVVVGAVPAGGQCALELSKLGRNVCLIERSKIIGLPNFSTGGTPNETMKNFDLPKKVTDSPWDSILFASKNERAEFLFGKRMGYVLNYMLLKQFLAKQAKKHGAEVLTGIHVDDVLIKNKFVVGISYNENGNGKKIFSKVVVDASGGRATLSQKLGLMKVDLKYLATGLEYYMKNVEFERKRRMDFYLGSSYAPGGYAWIFPSGTDTAKVGLGIFVHPKTKVDLIELLRKFSKTNIQTAKATETDVHGGTILANGGISNHVMNGFVVIGDAAGQVNPIAGEGIRHALYSGRFAAKAIDPALDKNNVEKKQLEPYNRLWKNYVGHKWKISLWLERIMCSVTLDDGLTDSFVSHISKLSPETFFDASFNYNFELGKHLAPKFLKIFSRKIPQMWK